METPAYTPEHDMYGFQLQSDTAHSSGQDIAASRKAFMCLQEQKGGWSHHMLSQEAERMNRKSGHAVKLPGPHPVSGPLSLVSSTSLKFAHLPPESPPVSP